MQAACSSKIHQTLTYAQDTTPSLHHNMVHRWARTHTRYHRTHTCAHMLHVHRSPGTHLTTVHIIHPQPYCNLTPTPYRLYGRPTHGRMHSHALTHDHFAQAKGRIGSSSPDLRVHISHPRCGEHTPAFAHPPAHYIHPNKHTDPLITYHPNIPHWTPHPCRAEEGPSWGSQPAG